MNLSFNVRGGTHGAWRIFGVVLSVKELIQLCSYNVRADGKIWKSDFYTGEQNGAPMNRPVTNKRTQSVKAYIADRLLKSALVPGALPAVSIAAFCEGAEVKDNAVSIRDINKVAIVDGLGRYSALLSLYEENPDTSLDVAVTLYVLDKVASEEETKIACRQILHDFNYFGTKMKVATSANFDMADVVSPLARTLHSKLADNGVNTSYGSLKQACVLLSSDQPCLYSATRTIKDRSSFNESAFIDLFSDCGLTQFTDTLAEALTCGEMTKVKRVLAPVLQTALHAIGLNPTLLENPARFSRCLNTWLQENPDANTSWRTRKQYEDFTRDFGVKLITM